MANSRSDVVAITQLVNLYPGWLADHPPHVPHHLVDR
jgi:hypothetical protein